MNDMKMNSTPIRLALTLAAVVRLSDHACAQSAGIQSGVQINPQTGLPVGSASGLAVPPPGLLQDAGTGLPAEEQRRNQAAHERLVCQTVAIGGSLPDYSSLEQAHAFSQAGQYEKALHCYQLACTHARATRDSSLFQIVIADWGDLGKKFLPASAALNDFREKLTRECLQGRDDFELFRETIGVNAALQDDEATVTLFKRIRQDYPARATEWYLWAEPVLVRCGQYQMCLDCIGNPEARFQLRCNTFKRLQSLNEDMSARVQESKRKAIKYFHRTDQPPGPAVPLSDPGQMALKHTRESFVKDVRNLIEILVGTSHQEVAEKICGEALAVLGDPRLQSAVSDAEKKHSNAFHSSENFKIGNRGLQQTACQSRPE